MSTTKAVERPYESLFICPSDAPQKNIDAFIEKMKATLTETKAVIRSVQVWGRRRLSFPIKHHRDGLYIYVDFNGESGAPEALKNLFRVSDLILRHIVVERKEPAPMPIRRIPGAAGSPAAGTEGASTAAPAAGSAPTASHPPAEGTAKPSSSPKEVQHG